MNKELIDHVWKHYLPKEFKEEVKKIYYNFLIKSTISQYDSGIMETLVSLFGIHNLTSDAEGEEILTCKKSKVQAVYKTSKEIVNNEQYGTCQYSMHTQIMCVLENLFGSKCLPDEKDDCKKFTKRLDDTLEGDIKEPFKEWYDKNYSNVEKLEKNGEVEPKPAEPKFKPGDKVLKKDHNYENEGCPYDIFLGYIGHDKGGYLCAVEAHGWIMHESELEPYTEPKPAEPKFKRCEKAITPSGEVCIIEDTHFENGSWLYLVGDPAQWISESDLKPYTEPKEEASKMKPIESKMSVYLATKEEDEEFRLLLHKNGFKWHTNTPLINLTCWSSVFEDSHIHYVHPDKTVTYSGYRTPNFLTFSEFKKQYFEENANLSQETPNCDNHFDNILKDGFSKERRLNIAAMVMQGVMANPNPQMVEMDAHRVADLAILMADTLIAECEKGDNK